MCLKCNCISLDTLSTPKLFSCYFFFYLQFILTLSLFKFNYIEQLCKNKVHLYLTFHRIASAQYSLGISCFKVLVIIIIIFF
ncbi:hypothetical protein C2G38_762239 [Gigaspora rosea]|uniref:Uncharacterized protein n=1 Tax=Gigaspora rosea TaxID=44941 RepID=A0A397TZZ9_9GLOM|nr:hypothetical protein C2G38_762239 [Gigaspora rosea]